MIDQPVLQGAHQQVNPFAPQTMPLRLVSDALQRQPAGERLLAAQRHALDGKAGGFRRERDTSEAGRGLRKAHIRRRRRQLLFQRLLTLLLNNKLIVRARGVGREQKKQA